MSIFIRYAGACSEIAKGSSKIFNLQKIIEIFFHTENGYYVLIFSVETFLVFHILELSAPPPPSWTRDYGMLEHYF